MVTLDSNALIHALKGKGRIRERIATTPPAELSIPAIVLFELQFGTLGAREALRRREELDRLLSVMSVLPFDRPAATHAARVRFELEKVGLTIGPLDTLIAGTALAHGAVLITNNVREYSRVPGLLLEDWT